MQGILLIILLIISDSFGKLNYTIPEEVFDSNEKIISLRSSVVLSSDVTIVNGGNGTQTNPYVIK